MMAAEQAAALRGELHTMEPLAGYTTWRVGGPARVLYRPADIDDLCLFLRSLPEDEPLLWLGLGSNLLVRDGGFAGSVILTQGRLGAIRVGAGRVYAEAGAACAKVARVCARANLVGGAFLAGIPGTMGGALAMNAGAFGGETWQRVATVTTVDRGGELRTRTAADFEIGYRNVRGPRGEWFVACELVLEDGDGAAEQARIRELLQRRAATQPTGLPSGGSTFRNPRGDHAARLIEAAGLKGLRHGGAEVSIKHANFIVSDKAACAADIEYLIDRVRERVAERFGVDLEPEVLIVGEAA